MQKLAGFFLLGVLFLSACSSSSKKEKTEAEVLFNQAERLIKRKSYLQASEKLSTLRTEHPYSFYATPAQLLQADVLFLQKNYVESASAYLLFKDFHPRHAKAPYVVWKIAESYRNQIPTTFDRDLSVANEAIKHYQEILINYPNSEYVEPSKKMIDSAQKLFKKKEQYIADFYFKTKEYQAARERYLLLLTMLEMEADKLISAHAMNRIIESSYKMKDFSACALYAEQYKDFLDSYIKDRGNECQKLAQLAESS
ncbi:MAG: outer membrane protein assembly factor BamD [Bacteriovoracaceae bacterium]|nr:outer membrane protein assembly factor BamD [Bacteriovoracaceae bacterium]